MYSSLQLTTFIGTNKKISYTVVVRTYEKDHWSLQIAKSQFLPILGFFWLTWMQLQLLPYNSKKIIVPEYTFSYCVLLYNIILHNIHSIPKAGTCSR